jgi:hypothetical protein
MRTCYPSYAGKINRRKAVQAGPGINGSPYSKNIYSKKGWVGGVAQVVKCPPSKHKVLNSNPNTTKKKKGNEGVEGIGSGQFQLG